MGETNGRGVLRGSLPYGVWEVQVGSGAPTVVEVRPGGEVVTVGEIPEQETTEDSTDARGRRRSGSTEPAAARRRRAPADDDATGDGTTGDGTGRHGGDPGGSTRRHGDEEVMAS